MHTIAIGVDTETIKGKPFTFQFYSEEISLERMVWLNSERNATREFCRFLDSLPKTGDRHYVLFGHNLAFDFVSLFYDRHSNLRNETVDEKWYGWSVHIVYAAVKFARFTRGNVSVDVIDTLAYFVRKLADLADMVCPDLPKLAKPVGLGKKKFKPKDKKFRDYAMRDAVIAYRVGLRILSMHRELDVSLAVSAPHFASKVFRKHFMQQSIPLPPRKIVYAAMNAYHGGKNNVTVSTGLYRGIYSLDIRSAYPHAMSSFPSFSRADLYIGITGNNVLLNRPLPPFGIYRFSGFVKACKYPIFYDHGFKPISGECSGIWITGFELNEAIRAREILGRASVYGFYYDAARDKEPSPFSAYVNKFFRLKDTTKDKIEREFWKLLLNSLYGKFIQTRSMSIVQDLTHDLDTGKITEDTSIVAGGLFNPFIAALITGHTRARIHQLEHQYKALHTSTDGIMLQGKRPKEIPGLGGTSIEAYGDALIFRNKLYIIYAPLEKGDKKNPKIKRSTIFKNKKIIKYALHGFHGDVFALERIHATGIYEYEYLKVNKLRESLRQHLQVNDFVTKSATLKLKKAG